MAGACLQGNTHAPRTEFSGNQNCGARRNVTLDDDEAGEYGGALDRGVDQIARRVAVLERRRLQAEVESLTIALERDLIGPDDFARRSCAS